MVHQLGEAVGFDFDTGAGRIHVERTATTLTPCGGLVAFAAFLEKLGIIEKMEASCPIQRTSNNATPVRDVLIGFILVCLQEGKRFRHMQWVQDDPAIVEIFKLKRRIPSDSSVIRFFKEIKSEQGEEWLHKAEEVLYKSLGGKYVLDWDSTVTVRFGEQEGAEVGYNPHKPGRPSHHPLLCTIAGTRLCLHIRYRSGKAHSSSGFVDATSKVLSRLEKDRYPYLNRADIAFATEEILAWHEASEDRPHYLFKLRKTSRVREAIRSVKEADWQGECGFGVHQVAERELQLYGWSKPRRVIVSRKLVNQESPQQSGTLFGICQYEYGAYVTDLAKTDGNTFQIVHLYNERCDCENIFDEQKNQWGLNGFCAKKGNVTEFAARMTILSYNMWSIFVRFFNITRHEEAQCSRKEFLFAASSLTRSGRETTLKMSVSDRIWERIRDGYQRLLSWIHSTAPQLKLDGIGGRLTNAFVNAECGSMPLLPASN
jgi:hypothetical protein